MAIQAAPNRGDQNRGGDNGRMGFNRGGPENRSAFNNDFNRGGRTDYRAPQFGGPRHDFSGFRDFHRDFRASHRFQVPSYRRPAGWYTHRWAFGEFLPGAFWARDYWLIDFADYDLPPPPFGAVWVRVDRDALLIDEESGEIITVAYDVFY
jgi:Ni/Co efflux regulator RcnB